MFFLLFFLLSFLFFLNNTYIELNLHFASYCCTFSLPVNKTTLIQTQACKHLKCLPLNHPTATPHKPTGICTRKTLSEPRPVSESFVRVRNTGISDACSHTLQAPPNLHHIMSFPGAMLSTIPQITNVFPEHLTRVGLSDIYTVTAAVVVKSISAPVLTSACVIPSL